MRLKKLMEYIIESIPKYKFRYATEGHMSHYIDKQYVGLRHRIDHAPIQTISEEMHMTESGVYKIYTKWVDLIDSGDVLSKAMMETYAKRTRQNAIPFKTAKADEFRVKRDDGHLRVRKNKPCEMQLFKVTWTPEDDVKARKMAREGEMYLKKFDAFRVPARMRGEYYTPGTNPDMGGSRWISIDDAAQSVGCDVMEINDAADEGRIQRRIRLNSVDKNIEYEYLADDVRRYGENIHKLQLLRKK